MEFAYTCSNIRRNSWDVGTRPVSFWSWKTKLHMPCHTFYRINVVLSTMEIYLFCWKTYDCSTRPKCRGARAARGRRLTCNAPASSMFFTLKIGPSPALTHRSDKLLLVCLPTNTPSCCNRSICDRPGVCFLWWVFLGSKKSKRCMVYSSHSCSLKTCFFRRKNNNNKINYSNHFILEKEKNIDRDHLINYVSSILCRFNEICLTLSSQFFLFVYLFKLNDGAKICTTENIYFFERISIQRNI